MVSLIITNWVILINFWIYSSSVIRLFEQFRNFEVRHFGSWSLAIKAAVVVIPIVINFVVFSSWNIKHKLSTFCPSWLYPVYFLSFFWQIFLPVVPIVSYIVFGQILLSSLLDNNSSLEWAVRKDSEAASLREIRQKSILLRRLYNTVEQVLSVPLLCCEFHITCTFINTAFVIILTEEMGFSIVNYLNVISNIMQLLTVGILGNIADSIQRAVSHSTRKIILKSLYIGRF